MITVPFGDEVILHRRVASGYDELGSVVWATEDVPVSNSVVYPETGSEAQGASDTATGRLVWLAPPGMAVSVSDRVTARGRLYEVDGEPLDYGHHAITGARARVQVMLRRST